MTCCAVTAAEVAPEILAMITDGAVVRAILKCLGLPLDAPVVHPARGPPELF